MNKYTVESPVRDFTGESVGVHFHKGSGSVDDATKDGRAAIEYFRRQGYALTPAGDDNVPADGPQKPSSTAPVVPFNPTDHDATEVNAYLDSTTDEDEIARVLEAERNNKARKTVLVRGEQNREGDK